MPHRYQFSETVLRSVVGGKSALDIPHLSIRSPEEAAAFIKGYGFDHSLELDVKKLWYFHRRALVFLEEKLGYGATEIPEVLRDPKQLGDIRQLLLLASSTNPPEKELQRWSCAILRVMHVFVHSENDLFSTFSEEIQKQILSPFQACIYHEGSSGTTFLKRSEDAQSDQPSEQIALLGFEVKPFKTSTSTVIKLLAKPDALAMSVYDKLGVRFITKSMFDAFQVVRFLAEENLISFPHIMPDQSSNNIYPVELFSEVAKIIHQRINKAGEKLSDDQVDDIFLHEFDKKQNEFSLLRKENFFSGQDYKFIKFICRKLIRIQMPDNKGSFSFFFPFEVQIMDQENHKKILHGPAEHQAYKERQRQAARVRVLPDYESKQEVRE
jgi:uncharacterized protein (TIGR04562 family)